MQYIRNVTTQQSLTFSQPVDYSSSTVLVFTSYAHNFQVVPVNVTVFNHFLTVSFVLSETQASYFTSGTTFHVTFGNVADYAQGDVPSDNVIQYQS